MRSRGEYALSPVKPAARLWLCLGPRGPQGPRGRKSNSAAYRTLRGGQGNYGSPAALLFLLLLLLLISPFGPRGLWAASQGARLNHRSLARINKYGPLHRDGVAVCVGVWSPHMVVVITSLPLMQFLTCLFQTYSLQLALFPPVIGSHPRYILSSLL